jgi:hypothetical protein
MNTDVNTVRLLGAAQLIVIVGSLIMDSLLSSAVGSGSMSDILMNISKKPPPDAVQQSRCTGTNLSHRCHGCFVLRCLLQTVQDHRTGGPGMFFDCRDNDCHQQDWGECADSFEPGIVDAGIPEDTYFQTLGDFLYFGVDRRGNEIHMLFLSLGFLLTNYQFYLPRSIPRAVSIWGLAAICLLLIPTVLTLYDREFLPGTVILAIPYAPY